MKKSMYTKIFLCTAVLAAVLQMTGCASRTEIKEFQEDMRDIRLRLSSLQSENSAIEKRLAGLQDSMQDFRDVSNRNKADIMAEMAGLRERNEYLLSLLSDTGDRMSELVHKMGERVSSRTGPAVYLQGADTSAADSSRRDSIADLDPQELYNSAYLDLSEQNYDLAAAGFNQYLRAFPQSEYADNALYWLGEIAYAGKQYEDAAGLFRRVMAEYPRGDKVPAAMLKLGFCQQNLNRTREARKTLAAVKERFPNSPEASLAEARLKVIE